MKVAHFRETMADREAIRHCLTSYSRGADRIDRLRMESAYWPEATDDHGGIFTGPAASLIEHALPLLAQLRHSTHFLGNMLIHVDGDAATAETYVLVYYRLEDKAANHVVGGRYLDRLEKRDDEWRISSRHLVIDWARDFFDPESRPESFVTYAMEGGRSPDDPSCRLFGPV